MRILVIGGAGYVGSKLVPELLNQKHQVIVYDLYIYGDHIFDTVNDKNDLKQIKADVRDLKKLDQALHNVDAVIHLACISNDPSFELNPKLGKSINLDSFEPLVKLAKKHKVKRFIYASSSSVYGLKSEPNVTEEMSLEPLTDYSKFKAECEKILLKHMDDDFESCIIRPATVCGYSPRQRLDVIVNILTNNAYHKGKIKVLGGAQLRPNIHIDDMVNAYITVLKAPKEKIQGQVFNAGYENFSVLEIAQMVKKAVLKKRNVELEAVPTNDNRSYHISSKKIEDILGFKPKYNIEDAVEGLIEAFETKKLIDPLNNKLYYNIATMKAINLE
ncbi:MAG: UDP-glucose 4-epimerase [Candidatus Anoxychlamydiales bacterium]|nr:UDP-glucose 4-epimerase [Candidatus Anoxychlamydiales bacterium]